MKKKVSKRARGRLAWSEAPNVDFGAYQIKQNHYRCGTATTPSASRWVVSRYR